MGVPMVAWMDSSGTFEDVLKWRESYLASMLLVRYADVLVMHGSDGWSLLPITVLRQNIYTDPRKPVAVAPGLKVFGTPDENSPVFFTSNFALTYYTVASDIESNKLNAYLIVVETEGSAIDSGVAGRKLTAERVADAIKASGIETRLSTAKSSSQAKHHASAAKSKNSAAGKSMVGPRDSSEIPKYLIEKWQP